MNTVHNKVYGGTLALDGSLGGGWNWDASYGYGHNNYLRTSTLQRDRALYALAADAIRNPANMSQIICRSTLTSPNNGCVPVNLFGAGSPSAAAIDYLTDTVIARNIYTQHAAQANLRGEPFSTWAAPVSLALGVEWRRETIAVTSDAKTPTGVYDSTGATDPFSGNFNVKEAYAEAVVPLAKDVRFARSLALNDTVRYADYSNFGGATTWKVGATYEPLGGILFRLAYSRDMRAPSLYELFLPNTTNFLSPTFRGTTFTNVRVTSSGNPALDAENARTLTIGTSIAPAFVPRLRVSVDYYRIQVSGAIGLVGSAVIAQACERGDQQFCSQLIFATPGDQNSALVGITDRFVNFSRFFTRGLDFTMAYSVPVPGGDLSLRGSASYVPTFRTITPGVAGGADTIREYAGGVGAGNSSAFPVPKWKGFASATYRSGWFGLTAQVRYVGPGRQNTTLLEAPTATAPADIAPAGNHIDPYAILNLSGTVDVLTDGRAQFFWVVNNLLDKDPPAVPSTVIQIQTNGSNYDTIGRYYRMGVRFKF